MGASVYEAATDTFAVSGGTIDRFSAPISADATGSHFLIGTSVFDASLRLVTTLHAAEYDDGPTAIAPDAGVAYVVVPHGYVKLRIPDGVRLERVLLPPAIYGLLVLPDGGTLVATTFDDRRREHRLWLVDVR
jgi:hypothetical protein